MSGIAEVMKNLGYSVQGSDVAEGYVVQGLRDKGIPVAIGHSGGQSGRCRGRRRLHRDRAVQSRDRMRAGTPHSRRAPRGNARRADAAEIHRRGGGDARQDDHHVDDRRDPGCGWRRSDRHQRRDHQQLRIERAAGRERLDGGRGGRERRQFPAARRHDRGRDQHRSRASGSLRIVRCREGRVRRLYRERALLRRGADVPRSRRGAGHPAAAARPARRDLWLSPHRPTSAG